MHAFLSASKYHWINYSEEKLAKTYMNSNMAVKGTRIHAFAKEAIELGVKLPRSAKTLNMFVNDAIGFRMTPEQVLFYSVNAFGTADAISFNKDRHLRIHDLKTGVEPSSMKQLEVYAALFCLEYNIRPETISMELRIYQNDDVVPHVPQVEDILHIQERIETFDKIIEELKATPL